MRWQAALAGALASALVTCAASADVRITGDPGGEVSSYVQKFTEIRDSGQRIVVDGPCLSACTLFTTLPLLSFSSNTSPLLSTKAFSAATPMLAASRACRARCLYSPCTGTKYFGFTRFSIVFSSSWLP